MDVGQSSNVVQSQHLPTQLYQSSVGRISSQQQSHERVGTHIDCYGGIHVQFNFSCTQPFGYHSTVTKSTSGFDSGRALVDHGIDVYHSPDGRKKFAAAVCLTVEGVDGGGIQVINVDLVSNLMPQDHENGVRVRDVSEIKTFMHVEA